jgi:NAD-dependent dihydropyrimidine dehydrogenase PreA subunit
MENRETYLKLAQLLDSFPQGFPTTKSEKELEILAYLFSPEEAHLASHLSLNYESLVEVTRIAGIPVSEGRQLAKSMVSKGLISLNRGESGIEIRLFPFIVGFYENQVSRMDETFAQLFEDYYREASFDLLSMEPQFHRVIPVNASINAAIEILPEENVSELISRKKAWVVLDCVCRKQQALLGKGCEHPLRVCLAMSDVPGVFDGQEEMEALDLDGALSVLDKAACSGLVHTVSNHKGDISYVCNCCTCSCGLLRGIAEANIANVVARSSYFATVDEDLCIGCGDCEVMCQFGAVTLIEVAEVNETVCVGCGVCARTCPEGAITLVMRAPEDVLDVPNSSNDWLTQRESARHQR